MKVAATETDTNRTIFRSAVRFFSGTMLSRITGMLRDICMAYAFGTESAIAALLVAFRFSHLLRRLLGEGAMQTALIPHFEELRKKDPQRAGQFFCDLTATLVHVLTILILIIMGGLGAAWKWGDLSSGNAEIAWLTFLMMPSLLFICLFGINAALMQCEKNFFFSSAAPTAFNLFWIAGIVFSSQYPPAKAMTILSLFIIGACFAQWAATLPQVYTILKEFSIKYLWKNGVRYSKEVLALVRPLTLGIIGIGASQINNALDAIFARWAQEEGPAFLWYAIRLQQLPLALFGIAIASALLPPLARAGKAQDTVQFHRFLTFAVNRTLLFMIPTTAALFIFGDACIHFIYGHGEFNAASIIDTTKSLWGYTIGLIPMALLLVLAPAFYSRGDYRTPSLAAVVSMILNIVLNTWLIAGLGFGAASIAIATSVSAWVNFFWLGAVLQKQIGWMSKGFCLKTGKLLLASMLAAIGVMALPMGSDRFLALEMIMNQSIPTYASSLVEQILWLGFYGGVYLALFVCGLYFFKMKFNSDSPT